MLDVSSSHLCPDSLEEDCAILLKGRQKRRGPGGLALWNGMLCPDPLGDGRHQLDGPARSLVLCDSNNLSIGVQQDALRLTHP